MEFQGLDKLYGRLSSQGEVIRLGDLEDSDLQWLTPCKFFK